MGWGQRGDRGIEQKGKRTHGHGQQCGDCLHVGGLRGINGNGKNTIKIKFKKRNKKNALSLSLFMQLVSHEGAQWDRKFPLDCVGLH